MKTYKQAVNELASQAFHNLMSGSMNSEWYGVDVEMVAWIFEVNNEQIWKDAEAQLKVFREEQHKKFLESEAKWAAEKAAKELK